MAQDVLGTLGQLCWPYKSLPTGLREAAERETQSELAGVLQDLRQPDARPELLAYAIRRLERLRDYGREPVNTHAEIAIELWRLLQLPRLGYSVRRKCAANLVQRLRGLRKEFVAGRGLKSMPHQDEGLLAKLREAVSWRTVQALMLRELERTSRGAPLEHSSSPQHFAESLAPLVNELRHWTSPEEAEEVAESLAPFMDPSQRSIVLFGRLMLMSLPTEASLRFVEDGRLAKWWEMLPRGANSRYSLMWVALPARAAKVRWASGAPWSPEHVLSPTALSAMMDTVAGTMCLPVDEGKSCDMDNFAEDCQWAFLGKTTYRLVAKFVVYCLEPLQPGAAFPEGSMWATLELLCRRLAPCVIHSGAWTWHVRTFLYELTRGYYVRACKERFREPGCYAHESFRMTQACDEALVRLVCPLLTETLTLQSTGGEQMHTVTVSMSFIARLSLLTPNKWDDVKVFVEDCVQDLADPMSVRHSSTLQLLAGFVPFLVYAAPNLVVDAAHLALPGIDATDPLKSLITAAFFVNLFVQIPTVDLSLKELPDELPCALREVLPMQQEGGTLVPGVTPGELQMFTSTMPDLCYALLERFLEYVQNVPKPSKKDAMAALDLAGPRMLATALFMAARQGDAYVADAMVNQLVEWTSRTLVPNAIKAVCMGVGAFCLAHQPASGVIMDSALQKLPLSSGSLSSLSESEATWHLRILAGAARFGGASLPPKRQALVDRFRAAINDSRKGVRKTGAKLCRRILMGLTTPWSGDLTGDGGINEALQRWSGAKALQWGSKLRPLEFHVPTAEELDFAHELCDEVLEIIRRKAEGSDEEIHTALTLAKSLLRGVACLYPDERPQEEITVSCTLLPNVMGPKIFQEVADLLLALCPKLGLPGHPFETVDGSNRPKLLCKALHMVVGLVKGERRPEIPDMMQIRGFDGNIRSNVFAESLTQKVHFMSSWRDVSRVWYNWEVLTLMNRRLHYRPTGFKFQGLRKRMAELLCSYTLHSNGLVSCTASECLQTYLRVHYGAKRSLLQDTLLPMQEKTISGATALSPEQAHLAESALQGFARTTARLFTSGSWRHGVGGAMRLASVIVRTINAYTEEGSARVDVRPVCISMQFELISKWGSAQTSANPGSPREACEAASCLLDLMQQPGLHWRTRVCILAIVGAGLRVMHLTEGGAELDRDVVTRWLKEVIAGLSGSGTPQIASVAVAELTAAMRSALRKPDLVLASVLNELLPKEASFLNGAVKVMSGLHQGHMGADAGVVAQADSVQCVVQAAAGRLGIPHLSWDTCPSGHCWTMQTAFFQTYVAFRARRGDESLVADLSAELARLQKQPKNEAEDHVLFIELLAGSLRAARRWPADRLAAFWDAVGPIATEELRTAEEENVRNWQFLVNYTVSGVSKRLRLRQDKPSEDAAVLRLAGFLCSPGSASPPALVAIGTDGDSHSHATKLRLLQVLLAGLRRRRPTVSGDAFVAVLGGIIPALKEGIAHPYKQVHEESAKALVMALHAGVDHQLEAKEPVVGDLREWLVTRAAELSPRLPSAPKDSPVSVECEGIVYCFIHGLLGRRLRGTALRSADLLLAAASADHHELRALAGLALGCLGQSHQRAWQAEDLARTFVGFCSVAEDGESAQRTRRLEAAAALVGAGALRHQFSLRTANGGEGVRLCREALLGMLQDKRVEVRVAVQTALGPLLGLESPEVCRKQVSAFVRLGPQDSVDQAVHGLGAMLSAAGSLGVPPWLGSVIEALAKVGRRPEAKKEVEKIVQAFMKQQQASRDLWKRCQTRLTPSQMDLLKVGRGTLSYYA